ncbi:MAG: HypC/HybG/HupF family hydrogenase formation chaperone [Planctomycetes bacterium]|nr:HypC/HybG/HupF family hydrogenase formation chaperone [Planctomycetota bacterium]
MCLAIPMQLLERGEFDGTCDLNGIQRKVGLWLTPDASQGDWVLVHAGFAIGVIDNEEAARTLALLESIETQWAPEVPQ